MDASDFDYCLDAARDSLTKAAATDMTPRAAPTRMISTIPSHQPKQRQLHLPSLPPALPPSLPSSLRAASLLSRTMLGLYGGTLNLPIR